MVFTPVTASQDGVVPRVDLPNINPNTNELKPRFLLHIQEAVNQLTLIPPPNPDGSTVFNTGSSVPLKFLLKDKNGNPVANAAVTFIGVKDSTGQQVGGTGATFTYDPVTTQYKYIWTTPTGNAGLGVWTLKYIVNYQTPSESILQGPNAQGSYTLKITGAKP